MATQNDLLKAAEVMLHGRPGNHFETLGMRAELIDFNHCILSMPFNAAIMNNRETGPLLALLDSCSGFPAFSTMPQVGMMPTTDMRIDYMGEIEPNKTLYADAKVIGKKGNIAFVRAVAHQGDINKPIAQASVNFTHLGDHIYEPFQALIEQQHPKINRRTDEEVFARIEREITPKNKSEIIDSLGYAKLIGMEITEKNNVATFKLDPKKYNVGNPLMDIAHGGVVAAFLEYSAVIHTALKNNDCRIPKVINFDLNYVKGCAFEPAFAECSILRHGKKLVSLSVRAWQENKEKPIASALVNLAIS